VDERAAVEVGPTQPVVLGRIYPTANPRPPDLLHPLAPAGDP